MKEEKDREKSCLYCKFFYSYKDMCEDDLEPSEYGKCTHVNNSNKDVVVGEDTSCEFRVGLLYE